MATYSTDLTTMTTAESGTWTEFASPYNGGGTPAANTENFIQGTGCYSQTTGKATDLEISCVFNNGSGVTFATDEVVIAWVYYAVGVNLKTYATPGWRFGIGSSVSAWDWFKIGGSDYGRNPYGGWFNVAIDPTATQDGTIGGGNGGTYQYFGSVPNTIGEISKGEPSAVDAIRYGRGEISITGTGGSFSELAEYNDYNAGGTPPGTSSTSVDSGRHRLGLFQDNGGTYLWKGLMSLGTTASSLTLTDSNVTILVEDCPSTYEAFNKIEVNNASTSITVSNLTITALGTLAPGNFEMIDNATCNLNNPTFNGLGTFLLDTNVTWLGATWNGCKIVTANGADLSGSSVLTPNVSANTSGLIWNVNTDTTGLLDGMKFSKKSGVAHHAIEFGTSIPTTQITLNNCDFGTDFSATLDGTTGDETFHFKDTTGTITLNLVGCTGNKGYRSEGVVVTIVDDPVTTQYTVTTSATPPVAISGARVFLEASDGTGPLPFEESVSITQTAGVATVAHTAHGIPDGTNVVIRGATQNGYNKVAVITVVNANSYTYAVDSGTVSPATGSPVASGVMIHTTTNVSGIVSDVRVLSGNQPFKGTIRSSSGAPYYQPASVTGTVSSTGGFTATVALLLDQ